MEEQGFASRYETRENKNIYIVFSIYTHHRIVCALSAQEGVSRSINAFARVGVFLFRLALIESERVSVMVLCWLIDDSHRRKTPQPQGRHKTQKHNRAAPGLQLFPIDRLTDAGWGS